MVSAGTSIWSTCHDPPLPPTFLLEFPWQLRGKWATFVGWDVNGTPSPTLIPSLSSAVSRPSWARVFVQTPTWNGSRTYKPSQQEKPNSKPWALTPQPQESKDNLCSSGFPNYPLILPYYNFKEYNFIDVNMMPQVMLILFKLLMLSVYLPWLLVFFVLFLVVHLFSWRFGQIAFLMNLNSVPGMVEVSIRMINARTFGFTF